MGRPRLEPDQIKQRHTIILFRGDYEELAELYPDVAPAVMIRTIVRDHIRKCNSGKTPKLTVGLSI